MEQCPSCANCPEECFCCNYADGEGYVSLGLNEAKRISEFTGKRMDEFAEFAKISEELAEELQKSDPETYSLFVENRRLALKLKTNGDCIFLQRTSQNRRCSIHEKRPIVCRMYPFWFRRENGKMKIVKMNGEEDTCPIASGFREAGAEAMAAFGETEDELLKLAEEAERELEEYKKYSKNLATGANIEEALEKMKDETGGKESEEKNSCEKRGCGEIIRCEDCPNDCFCCNYSRGDGFISIGLEEAKRISEFTGMKMGEFIEFGKISESLARDLRENDPDNYEMFIDDRLLMVKLKPNGDCVFLGQVGEMKRACTIHQERPIVCRMYPFWFKGEGRETEIVKMNDDEDTCPISKKFKDASDEALAAFNETREDLMKYSDAMDRETRIYPKYAKDLADGMGFEEVYERIKKGFYD